MAANFSLGEVLSEQVFLVFCYTPMMLDDAKISREKGMEKIAIHHPLRLFLEQSFDLGLPYI